MNWVRDDGGRLAAGFSKRKVGDCVARSIAIATQLPYLEVCSLIEMAACGERLGKRKRGISSPHKGVYKRTLYLVMARLDWEWTPTMQIGSGCKVHLRDGELPPGRLVVNCSKHTTAVIDGIIHDTHDPSRGGTRCVYGYWRKP
jgi:hypothetical protein